MHIPNVIQGSLNNSPSYRRFLEEEAAEKASDLKRIADVASEPLRRAHRAQTELFAPLWSKSVPELVKKYHASQSNPALKSSMFWNVLLRPTTERIAQDPDEAERVFQTFLTQTLVAQGWKLSPAGAIRFTTFVAVQVLAGGNNVTPDNLQLFFNALQENGCFDETSAELSYTEPQRAPEPERVPKLSDLDVVDTSTREAYRLVSDLWAGEVRSVLIAWLDDMARRWQFNPTEQQMMDIKQFIEFRNLDPRSPVHLDKVRVTFTRAGKFPERCLLDDELRSILLDKVEDRETLRLIRTASIGIVRDWMKRTGTTILY